MHLSVPILATVLTMVVATALDAQQDHAEDRSSFTNEARPGYIENRGQWDRRARFLLQSRGLDTWITDEGIIYDSYTIDRPSYLRAGSSPLPLHDAADHPYRTGDVVRMSFVGMTASPQWSGGDAAAHYNYYIGNDPSAWRTGVPSYPEARAANIYPGIDLRFYVDGGAPRYDLIVSPGADLSRVRMKFDGARSIALGDDASLVIGTSGRAIVQRGLYAYQRIDGRDHQVRCQFRIDAGGSVRFDLGAYDPSHPVVIDPAVYSTMIGGTNDDLVYGVSCDREGNIILAGHTLSTDFPITIGSYQNTTNRWVGFVAKLSADCRRLIFSTVLGGNDDTNGSGVTVGKRDANIYVSGLTRSTNFPASANAYDRTHNGNVDMYVTKLDSNGTMIYSTLVGGYGYENGHAIAVDSSGNAYVAGYTDSKNYPTTAGAFDTTQSDTTTIDEDGFVTKLNADGSAILYSTFLGGDGDDLIYAVAVDRMGHAWVTGGTNTVAFPVTDNAYARSIGGIGFFTQVSDIFVTGVGVDGKSLYYSTFLGGSRSEIAYGIAADEAGDIYVGGQTSSADYPVTFGTLDIQSGGEQGIVTKLNPSGLVYSRAVPGHCYVNALTIDARHNVYVAGSIRTEDLPITPGAITLYGASTFLTVLGPSGNDVRYCSYLTPGLGVTVEGIALDDTGSVVIGGRAFAIKPALGAYDTANGGGDSYAIRFFPLLQPLSVPSGNSAMRMRAITASPNPATHEMLVRFALDRKATVSVDLCGIDGARVTTGTVPRVYEPGSHEVMIDVSALPSGAYLARVTAGESSAVQRVIVMH